MSVFKRRRVVCLAPVLVVMVACGAGAAATPASSLVACRELGRGDMGEGQDAARATILDAPSTVAALSGSDRDWLREQLEGLRRGITSSEAAVLVEMGYGSGSELRPTVDGIEPQGGRIHARWEVNPRGGMTDDVTHEFVVVACPRHTLPSGAAGSGPLPVSVTSPRVGGGGATPTQRAPKRAGGRPRMPLGALRTHQPIDSRRLGASSSLSGCGILPSCRWTGIPHISPDAVSRGRVPWLEHVALSRMGWVGGVRGDAAPVGVR